MKHFRSLGRRTSTVAKADMACDVCTAFVSKNPMADETEARTTCQKAGLCSMSE